MRNILSARDVSRLLIALSSFMAMFAAATDISTVPLNTYSATSSTDVKPNVMFVLDDSGSMDWDYLPDNTNSSTTWQFRNGSFNGLAYSASSSYSPPTTVTSTGVLDTSAYPSMDGTLTTRGANGSPSASSPNWNAVKDDAYGIQNIVNGNPTTSNLTPNSSTTPYSAPFYYTTIPGEYCTNAGLRTCTAATAPTTVAGVDYKFPAYIRWCSNSGLTTCQASYDSAAGFTRARAPSPRTATIAISGSSSTDVSGITVDLLQIMAGTATGSTTTSTIAQNIVDQINLCTFAKVGNCTTVGFMASRSSSTVTITAPSATSSSAAVTKTGTQVFNVTAFAQSTIPGENLRTTIVPTVDSYVYPGTNKKAAGRSDCAGTTCTYNEEMTNYANWWTYYRTRMQMMKTAAANAFSILDSGADMAAGKSRYRVGYMTINNNQGSAFLNLNEFTGTQKFTWYSKLLAAQPNNSTPTRQALADAGRLYAGKLNGQSYNNVRVTDPLQYSCQHNYTLLSTDGFWNSGAGYKLDGSTAVGNQDAGDTPPYGDGGTGQLQQQTSQLQYGVAPATNQISTSTLQSRAITTLGSPPSIQSADSTNGGNSYGPWYDVATCTKNTNGINQNKCRYPRSNSSDSGLTWAAWTYSNNTCTATLTGTNQRACTAGTYYGPYTNVSTCTASSTLECSYTAWTAPTNTPGNSACTTVAQSAGPINYTVGTATQCSISYVAAGAATWIDVAPGGSCVSALNNVCRYTNWTAWTNVATCNAVGQDTGPTYLTTVASQCQTTPSGGTSDTLSDVAAYYYKTDLRSPDATAGTGTCTGPIISPATTANNLCTNNVAPVGKGQGKDAAVTQHMTTFTLGLGAQGKMVYAPQYANDYWQDASGDFYDVEHATLASPSTGICSWLTANTNCTWPTPASDSNANIDDLWHAAVNGHGTYFSAKDPAGLSTALTTTLNAIANNEISGTAAAAASSNPNVSSSDNYVFSSSYESAVWYGELVRQQIDPTGGSLTGKNWSAQRLLDCTSRVWQANTSYSYGAVFRYTSGSNSYCYWMSNKGANAVYASGSSFNASDPNITVVNIDEAAVTKTPVTNAQSSRTIYTSSGTGLINFDYATLSSAGLVNTFTQTYLSNGNSATAPRVSQFCAAGISCLASTDQADSTSLSTGGAAGAKLVNYLRGDPTYEGRFYRSRTHVLGDIVASEAAYVKIPLLNYTDAGFSDYKSTLSTLVNTDTTVGRKGMVYVGANDGMLHAFEAETGNEKWAFVPSMVLPNMYQLADINYSSNHQFFVDATPEAGDICVSGSSTPCTRSSGITGSNWKSILVGGLNRGGKGYYALDITNPASPQLLWEITPASSGFANLGYSYGNPQITKLKDGTWVVLLTSGYNNANGTGYLYVVNANTGVLIRSISTGATADLSHIAAHVTTGSTDNTAKAAYGGDTQGNLWRFDVNNTVGAAGYDAQLLVSLKDASGVAQPLTAKPTIASVYITPTTAIPIVYVGTGRYLGVSDITNTNQQSFYAVADRSTQTTYANPRSTNSGFVMQTLSSGTCPTGAPASVCTSGQSVIKATSNAVDWSSQNGWYIDFINTGERAFTDPSIGLGTLLFTTVVPSVASADPCASPASANSYIYALNYLTGGPVSTAYGVAGLSLGAGAATRPVMIELTDGTVRSLTRISDGKAGDPDPVVGSPPTSNCTGINCGTLRRVSWRELTTQ